MSEHSGVASPPLEPLHVSTQSGYDRWAAFYDEDDNPLVAVEAPRVAEALGPVHGLRVADVGCGTGRHTLALSRDGAFVTGLDFSRGMLERARARSYPTPVEFLVHDVTRPLPLPDAAFDRVLSGLVVDHIPDLRSHFRELVRVTRPGGCVIISVLHPAMMLRGVRARFRDPQTRREVRPASCGHEVSDYLAAAASSGALLVRVESFAVDANLAERSARAARYLDWPILLLLRLERAARRP